MSFPAWWASDRLPQMRSPPYLFQCQAEALFCPGSVHFLHANSTRIFPYVLGFSSGQCWPMCPTWDSLRIEKWRGQLEGLTVCVAILKPMWPLKCRHPPNSKCLVFYTTLDSVQNVALSNSDHTSATNAITHRTEVLESKRYPIVSLKIK